MKLYFYYVDSVGFNNLFEKIDKYIYILYIFEPYLKLSAINFSFRWNLFFKKLNDVKRA